MYIFKLEKGDGKDKRLVMAYLNQAVLLLNQNYEPLSVCNVKRAVVLIFLGKAEMVEKNSGVLHSINQQITIPSVIRLSRQIRVPHKRILLNRKNLMIRDNHTCQYCGKKVQPLTIDHVIPKQYGGTDSWEKSGGGLSDL